MLKEKENVRQNEGEHFRRLFFDDFFDLFVWYKENEKIYGFQLCYNKSHEEKVVTWNEIEGFSHDLVEISEGADKIKKSSQLRKEEKKLENKMIKEFKERGINLELHLFKFISKKLKEFKKIS